MAKRGEVLIARRKMGCGAHGHREIFVVVQGDFLSSLETAIVVPLDEHAPFYEESPLAALLTHDGEDRRRAADCFAAVKSGADCATLRGAGRGGI